MISRTTSNILQQLLENFPYEYNINQLSRMAGMSVGGVHRTLKKMETKEIVYSSKKGNALFYQLNMNNESCTKMLETLQIGRKKEFYSQNEDVKSAIDEIKNDVLKKALDRIFGMLLFKTNEGHDLLIISVNMGKNRFTELKDQLSDNIEKAKANSISVLILTLSVFEKHLCGRKGFYRKLWSRGIIIYGESFLFQELRRGVVSSMEG